MSSYTGTPQRANTITLADDGSPPQAASINPGIEANRDFCLWLEQTMAQSFARFSMKNFAPSNFGAAVDAQYATTATAIGACTELFILSLRNTTNYDEVSLATTRDGMGWRVRKTITMPHADNREYGALAIRDDGWVIAGMAGKDDSAANQGTRIDVLNPSGTLNTTARTVSSTTNYKQACFMPNGRAYCFGNGSPLTGGAVLVSGTTRVVTATEGGSFLDWTTPPGGAAFTGSMAEGGDLFVAQLGNVAIACRGIGASDDGYIHVDGAANIVSQLTMPAGASYASCNFTVWQNKFWCFKSTGIPAAGVEIYSSLDGVSWTLVTTLANVIGGAVNAVAEGGALMFLSGIAAGQPVDALVAHVSFDGSTWQRLPVTGSSASKCVASTAFRSALLASRSDTYAARPNNLRISLGGLQ